MRTKSTKSVKTKKKQKICVTLALSSVQMRELKEKSQLLKPVVIIGNAGLTSAVLQEIDRALYDHELIKIRIAGEDSEERNKITKNICATTQAVPIQNIGHVVTVYRKNVEEGFAS